MRSKATGVLGVAALVVWLGVGLARAGGEPAAGEVKGVELVREFGGTRAFTRPSRDAVMGFSLTTQVMEVLARGGQEVKKGEALVKGDDAEDQALLRLQLLRAETDLPEKRAKVARDLAELEFQRAQDLRERGGGSPQEFDRARLSLDGAVVDYQAAALNQAQEKIQVDRLRARLTRFTLSAPFDGQVESVSVDVGQAVSENDKVVRVVDVDPLWIDVPTPMDVGESRKVREGQSAWVLVEVGGDYAVREGKVIEVSPVADPASRTRRVRVELPNPSGADRLVAGEPAWVRFGERPAAPSGGEPAARGHAGR